jgi:hypothetical protein
LQVSNKLRSEKPHTFLWFQPQCRWILFHGTTPWTLKIPKLGLNKFPRGVIFSGTGSGKKSCQHEPGCRIVCSFHDTNGWTILQWTIVVRQISRWQQLASDVIQHGRFSLQQDWELSKCRCSTMTFGLNAVPRTCVPKLWINAVVLMSNSYNVCPFLFLHT